MTYFEELLKESISTRIKEADEEELYYMKQEIKDALSSHGLPIPVMNTLKEFKDECFRIATSEDFYEIDFIDALVCDAELKLERELMTPIIREELRKEKLAK